MTKYTFRNKLVNFRNFSIVESDATVNLGRPKPQKTGKTGKYMRHILRVIRQDRFVPPTTLL